MGCSGYRHAVLAAIAGVFLVAAVPAQASLIANGITYTLTETALNATTDQFTLGISGINGASDTEQGRYGVQSFAFNTPTNFSSAVAPIGFTYVAGGLNSSGCNNSQANFFCFAANTTPTGPALAANSTLSFVFDLTLSSGSFTGYVPDFKINWVGTKNNYNLVSLPLDPTNNVPVPEPSTMALVATGLLGLGWLCWRHKSV